MSAGSHMQVYFVECSEAYMKFTPVYMFTN